MELKHSNYQHLLKPTRINHSLKKFKSLEKLCLQFLASWRPEAFPRKRGHTCEPSLQPLCLPRAALAHMLDQRRLNMVPGEIE